MENRNQKNEQLLIDMSKELEMKMMAMHRGFTRHLICPKCNKCTWCKKVLKK